MLNIEVIKALMKIDTENPKDNRSLRIMSCDNPIKDNYVYYLSDIRDFFQLDSIPVKSFEDTLALCILKYNMDVRDYLNGTLEGELNTKCSTCTLSKEIIQQAIKEVVGFYELVGRIAEQELVSSTEITEVMQYKLPCYTAILQICGLVDISEDAYRSKFLDRFINIKDQVTNYKDGRMDRAAFNSEFKAHLKYLSKQIGIIKDYNMYEEDFLVYTIMFDIRHYKHNRSRRVLRKDDQRNTG